MLVEKVFRLFGEWTDELLAYAHRELKMGDITKKPPSLRLVSGMAAELPGN